MAISRETKERQVAEFSDMLSAAKMTVFAQYSGISVAELQELRRSARESGVTIKVVKNRLVRVALEQNESYKKADTGALTGQLLYATSSEDEVAPAQVLAQFGKTHDQLKLAGGFDPSGTVLDQAAVKALADLPTKDQLRGMLVSTIAAPLTKVLGVVNGAQRGFVQVISQQAEKTA